MVVWLTTVTIFYTKICLINYIDKNVITFKFDALLFSYSADNVLLLGNCRGEIWRPLHQYCLLDTLLHVAVTCQMHLLLHVYDTGNTNKDVSLTAK